MPGIITLTFNPCIDKSFSTDRLIAERKLACTSPVHEPGGGGINVARAIVRLGGDALAVFPAGGYHGDLLVGLLAGERVPVKPVHIAADTRENLNVMETTSERQFRFILPGPSLDEKTWTACIDALGNVDEGGYIVVSGSLPEGFPATVFQRIRALAERRKARVVADTSGPALAAALRCGCFMIKPSLRELNSLDTTFGLHGASPADKAKMLIDRGHASIVLVSAGEDGVTLATADGIREFPVPAVKKLSTVGAGDSLVAGAVLSLSRGWTIEVSIRYGVACAAATVMSPGTALCGREDTDLLYAGLVRQAGSAAVYGPGKG